MIKPYKIDKENLIITIPRFTTRNNPYSEEYHPKMDNIIGIYEDEYNNGLAYRIDMDYKGKDDQYTDYFFKLNGEKEEFNEMCKDLEIDAMYT